MTLAPGTRLAHYDVEALVGAGGMGEVYRARDTRLDRLVAIKILPSAKAGDPAVRQRFEREARTVATLSHPHICAIHDVGEHEGSAYIVMELLEGETLAERLRRRSGSGAAPALVDSAVTSHSSRGLPIEQALRHAIDVADALERAHRAGVIHRDLKPENIVLTKHGLKVVDFGLARFEGDRAAPSGGSAVETKATALTREATVLGTMPYMSPEQLEARAVDARSDIFAFGAVLYEMLVGRRAFAAKSEAALIASLLEHDPEPPIRLRPDVPPALDRLVRVCLAKDPDDRWQSAGDLRRELAWILEQGSRADDGGVPASLRRRRRLRLAAAAASAAVLAAIGLFIGYRAGRDAGIDVARSERRVQALRLQIPVQGLGHSADFALSPDGARLALVQADDANHELVWVRPLDGRDARPMPGTEHARLPFWSPDSTAIAFFADGRLKRVDVSTGEVRTIATTAAGARWGGCWGADGTIVYAGSEDGLRVVDASSGAARTVLAYERPYTLLGRPEMVPGGGAVLLPLLGSHMDKKGVYVWPLDGKTKGHLLVDASAASFGSPDTLFYFRDGTLFAQRFDAQRRELTGPAMVVAQGVDKQERGEPPAYAVSPSGTLAFRPARRDREQFIWYDRQGHVVGTLGPESDYRDFDLARDGPYVLAVRNDERDPEGELRSVWMLDAIRGGEVQLVPSVALRRPNKPAWLPGRTGFVMDLERRPTASTPWVSSIVQRRLEGGPLQDANVPTLADHTARLNDVSRDGRWVAMTFARYAAGRVTSLGAVATIGGSTAPLTFGAHEVIIGQVQFAPTGKHLAFHDDSSGRTETYLTTMPPSDKRWPLSTTGGGHPRFRADGREVYYLALDGTLMAVDVQLGATVAAGVPKPLFRPRGRVRDLADDRFAVSADGERFLVKTVVAVAADEPVTIVTDWTALLPRPGR